ncbi:MerR family transcriptional regulator [Enterococcus sp. HY326]|uniref:MerR family transcriptional regulator n=1 Tax=Enterococcus sp. HY326 TaxID=2971265 RepID=UPI002240B5D7|nr:MerR family transcriptional regulator [Enterococcus sp. HY326]
MEYTVQKLAKLSGVSSRTLRYYDQIALLKPARLNSAGYRIYGKNEVNRLQQILFYRQLEFSLEEIQKILDQKDFDYQQALQQHYQQLLAKREQIDLLLQTVSETLAYYKGEKDMQDSEKFAAFKTAKLAENQRKYGAELKEKYPVEQLTSANQKWQELTESQFAGLQAAENTLIDTLNQLLTTATPAIPSPLAEAAFTAHKKWLTLAAPFYSGEYHKNLALMYVEDPRFAKYYNEKTEKDSVALLKQIIDYYA